jgi:hypothetical protein
MNGDDHMISDPDHRDGWHEPSHCPKPYHEGPEVDGTASGAMNGHAAAAYDDIGKTDELAAIKSVLRAYHEAAAGLPGVFVLTVIDPRKGIVRPQLFAIGDVDGMAREAFARGEHSNVYFAPAVLRKDLLRGRRGKEEDIVAVLGLPIDDDGDTGKRAVLPPGIGASIEITTSTNPTLKRHLHFVFTRPLPLHQASVLAAGVAACFTVSQPCGAASAGFEVPIAV